MNAADEIKRLAEQIAETSRTAAHALEVASGALDELFNIAVEAEADPSLIILLYGSKALARGADALRANQRAAVEIYAYANQPQTVKAGSPELMAAMRSTAERLHVLLEQSEDTARLLTSDVWRGRDKT